MITALTLDDVLDAVRAALSASLRADALSAFLAAIDWTGMQDADPAVAEILGKLEAWDTDSLEHRIATAEYAELLLSLLPPRERATYASPAPAQR